MKDEEAWIAVEYPESNSAHTGSAFRYIGT